MPNRPALHALGLNHQTAPVALRERLAFDAGALPAALAALRSMPGVHEVAILSTCNRTELYAVADDGLALERWLASSPAADAAHGIASGPADLDGTGGGTADTGRTGSDSTEPGPGTS